MRGLIMLPLLFATSAQADVLVRFSEGAPKDRFTITNMVDCAIGPIEVTVDLSTSASGLIFDVTGNGAGVEVYQPFELVAGEALIDGMPRVEDGDQAVRLQITGLEPGARVAFTIDVDDTIGAREITVTDAEIEGAVLRVRSGDRMAEARFESDAVATLDWSDCAS